VYFREALPCLSPEALVLGFEDFCVPLLRLFCQVCVLGHGELLLGFFFVEKKKKKKKECIFSLQWCVVCGLRLL